MPVVQVENLHKTYGPVVAVDDVSFHVQGETLAGDVVSILTTSEVRFRNLRTEQTTLEDVFLTLTGREMRD